MKSAFAWPGGKRALTPTLLKLIPEHRVYVEVFAGSAKLLFAKEPSKREVMNDLNGEVTNFFRVAKHRTAELAERLELECVHAGRFRELLAAAPECEVDRALRFAYLAWYSFGAKGEHFASLSAPGGNKRSLATVRDLLGEVASRLRAVHIEQRDCMEIIDRYDAADSFLYLDPPYVAFGSNGRYEPLTESRRAALFARLAQAKGRFLMSFDDVPEIRARAKEHGMYVRGVEVTYTLSADAAARRKAAEVLVSNYKTPA